MVVGPTKTRARKKQLGVMEGDSIDNAISSRVIGESIATVDSKMLASSTAMSATTRITVIIIMIMGVLRLLWRKSDFRCFSNSWYY